MTFLESITEILKTSIWPIFLFIIIIKFRDPIFKIGAFFGELIKERGAKARMGSAEVEIPGVDPESAKQKIADEAKDNALLSYSPSLSSSSSSSLSNLDESILMGFRVVGKNKVEITDTLSINWNPDMKTVITSHYEIGQRVLFAIANLSDYEYEFPFCAVQFPAIFKHLSTESPETGAMMINSDLWGLGGITTELVELTAETTEISGLLGRKLLPGKMIGFFIRFKIPEHKADFKLIMKFRVDGNDEIQRELNLLTNQ